MCKASRGVSWGGQFTQGAASKGAKLRRNFSKVRPFDVKNVPRMARPFANCFNCALGTT